MLTQPQHSTLTAASELFSRGECRILPRILCRMHYISLREMSLGHEQLLPDATDSDTVSADTPVIAGQGPPGHICHLTILGQLCVYEDSQD